MICLNRFSDELITDLLCGVAGEMGSMCDGLVERMVSSEFSTSPA